MDQSELATIPMSVNAPVEVRLFFSEILDKVPSMSSVLLAEIRSWGELFPYYLLARLTERANELAISGHGADVEAFLGILEVWFRSGDEDDYIPNLIAVELLETLELDDDFASLRALVAKYPTLSSALAS